MPGLMNFAMPFFELTSIKVQMIILFSLGGLSETYSLAPPLVKSLSVAMIPHALENSRAIYFVHSR